MTADSRRGTADLESRLLSHRERQQAQAPQLAPTPKAKGTTFEESRKKDEASPPARAVLSCVSYASMSVLMILVNKWLATAVTIDAQVSLLFMQNVVATSLVVGWRFFVLEKSAALDVKTAYGWLPVNISFVLMLWTSFAAMRHLSVPMITVFKQFANLLTCLGEVYLFGQRKSPFVFLSFFVMILGAALAAHEDTDFSVAGYAWQIANCVATSAYVLTLRHATTHFSQLSRFHMVYYNNVLSLPLLLLLVLAKREPRTLGEAYRTGHVTTGFLVCNAATGFISVVLSLASVWCVAATSATTYAVAGALNKLPVALLGFFIFDAPISKEGAVYIAFSLFGGMLYTYEKIFMQQVPSVSASSSSQASLLLLPSSSSTERHQQPLLLGCEKQSLGASSSSSSSSSSSAALSASSVSAAVA